MHLLGFSVVLGVLAGVQAQVQLPQRPNCDSPLVEEAALAAREHLNAQHTHGYKYELNRIEDVKVYGGADGEETYVLELDLLETNCHALDPTPLANCTVRPKQLTAVEGDCDVVLKKVGGALSVTAFKCKTEESREDFCVGCPTLLPLNNTDALNFIQTSLATFNNKTVNTTYNILQVGRLSSQIVSGGAQFLAEFVIVEANCTGGNCVSLDSATAEKGFCTATGRGTVLTVDCKMFPNLTPIVDANTTGPAVPPVIHAHGSTQQLKHGLRHHKLTTFHNPHLSTHLSAESLESDEIVPVAPKVVAVDAAAPAVDAATPAPAVDAAPVVPAAPDAAVALDSSDSMEVNPRFMFRRDVAPVLAPADVPAGPVLEPVAIVPPCPGRVRFFK